MKRLFLFLTIIFISVLLTGCVNDNQENLKGSDSSNVDDVNDHEDEPPKMNIKVNDETYKTSLGSYCWSREGIDGVMESDCIDKSGNPVELIKNKEPVQVKKNENIILNLEPEYKLDYVQLTQYQDGDDSEINVKKHQFTSPEEKGVYYYYEASVDNSYDDEISYAFVIEVQ